jgi:DNA-binding protein HU-beta
MNTTELAEHVAATHDLDRSRAKRVIETVFAAIVETAATGQEVALSGFGRFKVADRAARQGRNPATGEVIEIAASKKLAFTPAKAVRDALGTASSTSAGSAKAGLGKSAA